MPVGSEVFHLKSPSRDLTLVFCLLRLFSFQEALDWRFLVRSDFLVASFVNCT
ncbi:hypothetical protein Bca4012_014229 [Brassica carinata]